MNIFEAYFMQVNDVYIGPNGLLHGGNILRPWLLIDSSTIDPQTSRKLSLTISNCILKRKKGSISEIKCRQLVFWFGFSTHLSLDIVSLVRHGSLLFKLHLDYWCKWLFMFARLYSELDNSIYKNFKEIITPFMIPVS